MLFTKKAMYPPLFIQMLSIDPDEELPACANFPPPWRCEFFFSIRANQGFVNYHVIDRSIRDQVVSEFARRNFLGHESVMDGAMTYRDYCYLYRILTEGKTK